MMCAGDAILSPNTKRIIKKVKQVYLEVDLDDAGELLSAALSIRHEGPRLRDVLTEDEYHRIQSFFSKAQPTLPFEALEQQPPLLISSTLYEFLLDCDRTNGIELLLVDEAYKQKKKTSGLETVAFQMSIFQKIPYEVQAKELLKTVDSIGSYKKALDEMIVAYRGQDIDRLYNLSTHEDATAAYSDLLIDDRNEKWVQQFDTIATKQPTLFAVGAGHLGGAKGVVNLLKNKGYNVRAIENDMKR